MTRNRHKNKLLWNPPLPAMVKVAFKKSKPRLMLASNEFYPTESAQWERIDGQWHVTQTTTNLQWMLKMEPAQAKLELARKGFSWKWQK